MKKRGIFKGLAEAKRQFIDKIKPGDMKNHDGKSFTRKRSLTLQRLLTIILSCCPGGLQVRLDDFYEKTGNKEETVSKQAFSKARGNLAPEIVEDSFRLTTRIISECDDLELFKGRFRLCAIDGSDVALDNADELLKYFGGSGKNKDCVMAKASLCYDPLNNIILDGGLYPYGFSEREAARKHFKSVSELPLQKGASNLYLADRGYPSKELFADMLDSDTYFLTRVRQKFSADFDSIEKEGFAAFTRGGKAYRIRVFNITLDSGEKEILATNLGEGELTYEEAGELQCRQLNVTPFCVCRKTSFFLAFSVRIYAQALLQLAVWLYQRQVLQTVSAARQGFC